MDHNNVSEFGKRVLENVSHAIVGKQLEIEQMLVAVLSDGHILLEDVPGVGKTMLARAMAISLGCSFSRIQCTPDLLPSDVTGVSIYDQKSGDFVFRKGPVMAQIVLVDEINRATPRTQSSLLECMGEGQVTVDGETHQLAKPFMVLATQNPVEYEGTFPLPEAQLDRFFMKLSLGYPNFDEENTILQKLQEHHPIDSLEPCATPSQVREIQVLTRKVFLERSVREYVVRLTQATRKHPAVLLGASPRGSLALFRASQVLASLRGRDYVLPDDIKALAIPILAHRIMLKPENQLRGVTSEQIISSLLNSVAVNAETE